MMSPAMAPIITLFSHANTQTQRQVGRGWPMACNLRLIEALHEESTNGGLKDWLDVLAMDPFE